MQLPLYCAQRRNRQPGGFESFWTYIIYIYNVVTKSVANLLAKVSLRRLARRWIQQAASGELPQLWSSEQSWNLTETWSCWTFGIFRNAKLESKRALLFPPRPPPTLEFSDPLSSLCSQQTTSACWPAFVNNAPKLEAMQHHKTAAGSIQHRTTHADATFRDFLAFPRMA